MVESTHHTTGTRITCMHPQESWDHTVREEEQRRYRGSVSDEEAFQTYIRGVWPTLSDLDLAELGLVPTEDRPMTRTD
jgi:hypothetical protein